MRKHLVEAFAVVLALTGAISYAQPTNCPFNLSNASPTGAPDALRDTMVMLRYARGVRGSALIDVLGQRQVCRR
jgi:hypothetical protein